ncbi:hypothetical protein Bca4012_026992 [Brassica carinata]
MNSSASTPDSASAVKSKSSNASSLAGTTAQKTPSPPAQDPSAQNLAKKIETPKSETLATELHYVPGKQDQPAAALKSIETPHTASDPSPGQTNEAPSSAELWKGFVKESAIKLNPKQTPYVLDSGEACVTIPNSVVEKNKKAWEYFILGQFYEDPPARDAIHAILNGICSRHKRDITFTGVPLQFFNEEALQEIAGLVGHPVCLHPTTKNLTNIEVAKVYTVIDPQKPLPEFVNAHFESGDTRRIGVSSPWLPSRCSYCNKSGHTIMRCKSAPPTCTTCNSVRHVTAACPRTNHLSKDTAKQKGKAPIKSLLPIVGKQNMVYKQVGEKKQEPPAIPGEKKQEPPAIPPSSSSKNPPPAWPALPAPLLTDMCTDNGRTVTVKHDLSKGSLSVDFSTHGHLPEHSSTGSSSDTTLSKDEDSPDDDNDRFLEVFSKRYQKRFNTKARARGPSIL